MAQPGVERATAPFHCSAGPDCTTAQEDETGVSQHVPFCREVPRRQSVPGGGFFSISTAPRHAPFFSVGQVLPGGAPAVGPGRGSTCAWRD